MRKLDFPVFDDYAAIDAVADHPKLGSYPTLQVLRQAIKDGYTQYNGVNGNAQNVATVNIPAQQAVWLRKHYKDPPICLQPLDDIRTQHEALPCTMCGSLHSGTLDHVLPKEDHPSFAVFSKNLVPACNCNHKRGRHYRGNAAGARVLHPYYDECLNQRLYSAKFTDLGATAIADLEIIAAQDHLDRAAIEFHLEHVIKKTGVLNWLRKRWVKLVIAPKKIIGTLNAIPHREQDVIDAISEHREARDFANDSPNNWESMFAQGLLDPLVVTWLYQRLSAAGREADDPLIPIVV